VLRLRLRLWAVAAALGCAGVWGNVHDLGASQVWADDPSLDTTWLRLAEKKGELGAEADMSEAGAEAAQRDARLDKLEEGYARADAGSLAVRMKEAKASVQRAKRHAKAQAKKATMDSVTKDKVESRGISQVERIIADEDAPDARNFMSKSRQVENSQIRQEMQDDLFGASQRESESDAVMAAADRRVQLAKQKYQNLRDDKMVADSMVMHAKHDTQHAEIKASMAAARLSTALRKKAAHKMLEPPAPRPFHEVGDFIQDHKGNLVRVRHHAEASDGLRTMQTLVNGKMVTLRVSESAAAQLADDGSKLLGAHVQGASATAAERRVEKDRAAVAKLSGDEASAAIAQNKDISANVVDSPTPDLGQGTPMQLLSPSVAEASEKKLYPAASVVVPQHSVTDLDNIDHMLSKVNGIAAILEQRSLATAQAITDADQDQLQSTEQKVGHISGELQSASSAVLALQKKKDQDLRSAQSQQPKVDSETTSEDSVTIARLKARIQEKQATIDEQQKKLESFDQMGNTAKTSEDMANDWMNRNAAKWQDDTKKFTQKLNVLKKAAKRVQLAKVSTAQWAEASKLVDESADDLRMAKYLGTRSAKKFVHESTILTELTKRVRKMKKERLYAKQEFQGFGPKMSEERATASASAASIAKFREEAKQKYEDMNSQYKNLVKREQFSLKERGQLGSKMMTMLQKQLKAQKVHYENKLRAADHKLKAEIARRSSCKTVSGHLKTAVHNCDCKDLTKWADTLASDSQRSRTISLSSDLNQCKREVQRCKIAYRKQGLVYAVPLKSGTLSTYAETGKVPSVDYNMTNNTANITSATTTNTSRDMTANEE